MPRQDVLAMIKDVDVIYATKGRSVVHFDLKKEQPGTETLLSVLLGRTGNLRSPALRQGRTLIVGFDETMYRKIFCK